MSGNGNTSSGQARAQLGCGTLILIAIIVALFSGRGDVERLREEIAGLREQVTRLEAKLDGLGERLPPAGAR